MTPPRRVSGHSLEDLISEWAAADAKVIVWRQARDSERCEIEYRGSGAPDDPSEGPCWHDAINGPWQPGDELCEPCRRRQKAQAEMVKAKRVLRNVLAKMRRVSPIHLASRRVVPSTREAKG